jgi:hypothetical protein
VPNDEAVSESRPARTGGASSIPVVLGLAGLFFAISLLVAAAGALKAARPHTTARALAQAGFGVPAFAVRMGGLAEVVVGGAAVLVAGWVPAALVAVSYAAFAVFVGTALWRGTPLSSCGCFGREDTPPTVGHLVFNLAAAGVAIYFSLLSPPGVGRLLARQPGAGVPFALLVLTTAGLAALVLTELPRTLAIARSRREP